MFITFLVRSILGALGMQKLTRVDLEGREVPGHEEGVLHSLARLIARVKLTHISNRLAQVSNPGK